MFSFLLGELLVCMALALLVGFILVALAGFGYAIKTFVVLTVAFGRSAFRVASRSAAASAEVPFIQAQPVLLAEHPL